MTGTGTSGSVPIYEFADIKISRMEGTKTRFLVLNSILYSALISHQSHVTKSLVSAFSEAN